MKIHRYFKAGQNALLLVVLGLSIPNGRAATYNANFLGGTGVWEQDGSNWDTIAYPQNGHFVFINGNRYPDDNPFYNVAINIAAPCTLGTSVRVETVNVSNGSTLNLAPTYSYNFWANTGLDNAGLITLNSTSNSGSGMRLGSDSSVANGGEIFMSDSPYNLVTGGSPGKVFTVFAGGKIRGAGSFNTYLGDDVRTYMQWVNHGLIEAMQPLNPLRINLTDQAGITNGLINDATLRARDEAVLRITAIFTSNNSGNVLNQGGTIEAIDNGTVRIASGVTVTGGTLSTSGNGTIRGDYPGSGGGTLNNVTNTGLVALADSEGLGLGGTFTNNGQVTLDSTGSGSSLYMRGNVTVAGNGSITLGSSFFNEIAGGGANGYTLTVGSGATITGGGHISTNNANFGSKFLNVVNQGLIESTSGMTIYVNDAASSTLTNTGTLRANGANLAFQGVGGSDTVTNNGGTVEALAGSSVIGSSVSLVQNSGTIDLADGNMTFPAGVDLNGGAMIGNGTFTGPIRNSATVAPGHSAGQLNVDGNLQLNSGSILSFEIGGTTPGTGYDVLNKIDSGTLTLGGALSVGLINGFTPAQSDVFTIVTTQNMLAGSFSNVANGARLDITDGAGSFKVTYSVINDPLLSRNVMLSDFQPNPAVRISVSPVKINEGETATFTFTSSPAPSQPMTVRYGVKGGATRGSDYRLSGTHNQVTFSAGQSSATVLLRALVDGTPETGENATLTVRRGSGYQPASPTRVTVRIRQNQQ